MKKSHSADGIHSMVPRKDFWFFGLENCRREGSLDAHMADLFMYDLPTVHSLYPTTEIRRR